MAVEGATTPRIFETYVEKVLAPSLEEGHVMVMYNLGVHRPKRIREMIEQLGWSCSICRPTLQITTP